MIEDALALTRFHYKQSRPFLIKASTLAIDEGSYHLGLGAGRRRTADQRRGEGKSC